MIRKTSTGSNQENVMVQKLSEFLIIYFQMELDMVRANQGDGYQLVRSYTSAKFLASKLFWACTGSLEK